MSVKYQMTQQGMQSMFTLAWRGVTERTAHDPIFVERTVEADESDHDAMLLEVSVVAPGRAAPLEEAIRSQSERERVLARREVELLRLGYTGF
jgi:hypothetical protein